jgi:hypothetical protein
VKEQEDSGQVRPIWIEEELTELEDGRASLTPRFVTHPAASSSRPASTTKPGATPLATLTPSEDSMKIDEGHAGLLPPEPPPPPPKKKTLRGWPPVWAGALVLLLGAAVLAWTMR